MVDLTVQNRADIELLWNFHVVDSGEGETDFLLALGSHDLRVADYAGELFLSGAAPFVVVTGGAGKVTGREWDRSEAELYCDRLVKLGVPENKIILEQKSSNSGENFEFSRTLLESMGMAPASGTIVSKSYMARRALATARKQWPEVAWHTRPPKIGVWEYPSPDTPLDRMVNLMVGDLQRLRVYGEQGFQVPVEIPEDVWSAYERLARSGFDRFVIK